MSCASRCPHRLQLVDLRCLVLMPILVIFNHLNLAQSVVCAVTSVAAYCQPVHAFCICVHLASSVHVNFNYYHYLCMFLLQLSGPDVYHGVPHDYTNLVCICSSGVGPISVIYHKYTYSEKNPYKYNHHNCGTHVDYSAHAPKKKIRSGKYFFALTKVSVSLSRDSIIG